MSVLVEYRAVVEYDDDSGDQLLYGPDVEDGAENRARQAAQHFRHRDFEAAVISVERREVQPWETVVAHHTPDTTPPHPTDDPSLAGHPTEQPDGR